MKAEKRRSRLFADRKLQGTLLVHTCIYWFYCLFSVALIAICWIVLSEQANGSTDLFGQLWLNCGPALLGSVLLLPLVLLDCLRISNRFAGPMVRLQRAMRQLEAGERPDPIQLRENDHWREFADNFNSVVAQWAAGPAPARQQTTAAPLTEQPACEVQSDTSSSESGSSGRADCPG